MLMASHSERTENISRLPPPRRPLIRTGTRPAGEERPLWVLKPVVHTPVSRHFDNPRCSPRSHLPDYFVHDLRTELYVLERDSFIVAMDAAKVISSQLEWHEPIAGNPLLSEVMAIGKGNKQWRCYFDSGM